MCIVYKFGSAFFVPNSYFWSLPTEDVMLNFCDHCQLAVMKIDGILMVVWINEIFRLPPILIKQHFVPIFLPNLIANCFIHSAFKICCWKSDFNNYFFQNLYTVNTLLTNIESQ